MTFVVGTGPTELHAHIDLDHRITATHETAPTVTVLDVTCCDSHWAVLATVHTDTTGKEPQ